MASSVSAAEKALGLSNKDYDAAVVKLAFMRKTAESPLSYGEMKAAKDTLLRRLSMENASKTGFRKDVEAVLSLKGRMSAAKSVITGKDNKVGDKAPVTSHDGDSPAHTFTSYDGTVTKGFVKAPTGKSAGSDLVDMFRDGTIRRGLAQLAHGRKGNTNGKGNGSQPGDDTSGQGGNGHPTWPGAGATSGGSTNGVDNDSGYRFPGTDDAQKPSRGWWADQAGRSDFSADVTTVMGGSAAAVPFPMGGDADMVHPRCVTDPKQSNHPVLKAILQTLCDIMPWRFCWWVIAIVEWLVVTMLWPILPAFMRMAATGILCWLVIYGLVDVFRRKGSRRLNAWAVRKVDEIR